MYSVKKEEEICYAKEFDAHKKNDDGFDYVITLTKDEENAQWSGERGRITTGLLKKNIEDASHTTAFICGPKEFVYSMIDLLNGLGISKEQIRTDVWGE